MGFKDALTCVDCQALLCNSFHGFKGGPFLQCEPEANRHGNHIDWIWSRSTEQLCVEPLQATMVPMTWTNPGGARVMYPSDHLPIVVEFGAEGCAAACGGDRGHACECLQALRTERFAAWNTAKPRWAGRPW
eukprot:TRINITY_DN67945_c0_g1_i1.p2 TRINITY_DN67945_c0_g1~~TRINITY_DN67945_c0_g1_i1.p2  ORF type:complete len:149 (-),score=16.35 TRINITY_DN67945_c0_g1_i1:153-548(-)